jgi:hypothetical protein
LVRCFRGFLYVFGFVECGDAGRGVAEHRGVAYRSVEYRVVGARVPVGDLFCRGAELYGLYAVTGWASRACDTGLLGVRTVSRVE